MSRAGIEARNFRLQTSGDELANRPYGSITMSTNPAKDTITYQGPHGPSTFALTHPYLGPSSWIRVMPEQGTSMVVDSRADSGKPFVAAYMAEESAGDFIRATYQESRFFYRRLQEGEIDITSKGLASSFFSKDGTLALRAGVLSTVMDVPHLEVNTYAPTVVDRVLGNVSNEVSSESRFGVVKRLLDIDSPQASYIRVEDSSGEKHFAMESLRNLVSSSLAVPLIDHREGNVIEGDGSEATSPVTGKKLRSRTQWGTIRSDFAVHEVDEEGNMSIEIPNNASYGFSLNVVQKDVKFVAGRDILSQSNRNYIVAADQTAEVDGNSVKLGSRASSRGKLIRGEDFRDWLRNATVLTAMGPAKFSSVDVESAFTSTLSTKVTTE